MCLLRVAFAGPAKVLCEVAMISRTILFVLTALLVAAAAPALPDELDTITPAPICFAIDEALTRLEQTDGRKANRRAPIMRRPGAKRLAACANARNCR